jgi:hypothetical protein
MNLWRTTRTEAAGAWRSLRYDMSKRDTDRRQPASEPGVTVRPDVTSTGMSTFGGPVDDLSTDYAEFGRPPRRMVAVSVFALLTVAGAAGSYFAVVNGLGSLLRDKPATAEAYPMAAAAPTAGAGATTGIGRGAAAPRAVVRHAGVPTATATTPAAVPPTTVAAPPPAPPRRTVPERAARPARSTCACLTPPVPTPTGPSTSPKATPSPTASPSRSGDPSVSPTPSGSTGPREPAHRKRRPRGY